MTAHVLPFEQLCATISAMLSKVTSGAVIGLDGAIVEVEVDILPGLPKTIIVGLPDTAVEESSERVRSAIRNSGGFYPGTRVVVNLAPADLKKAGPAYDLPIAVGILISSKQLKADVSGTMLLGELSLDGALRHTNGVLSLVALAKAQGIPAVIVPEIDAREASLVEGVKIIPIATLAQLVQYLSGDIPAPALDLPSPVTLNLLPSSLTDMADIKGQEHVKRALEVAAAGGHNMIMCGPPGSGKTLLARSLPSILPHMTGDEALEVTKIYSVSGLLPADTPLMRQRPFRAPHYTISNAGLVGGGHFPKPGEISLSHRGVLFLDELPEFGSSLLEVLRQPLEDKVVTISRAQGRVTFPSSFMLIGAMNPCPCGYHGDPFRKCSCPPSLVSRYQRRISGPFLDRVDIFVEVPHIAYEKLADERRGETSAIVQARVTVSRERQQQRFTGTRLTCNAEMTPTEIRDLCKVEDSAKSLLAAAMKQLYLSARAFHRILKLALTIADLEGSDIIKAPHIAEAVQYRPRRTE
jgi:magnesium chelatase family protein